MLVELPRKKNRIGKKSKQTPDGKPLEKDHLTKEDLL